MNELLESALAWAEAGFYIFPCTPGGKTPACANGLNDATDSLEVIKTLWSVNPNYNIGIAPARSGCYVLDQDGPLGAEALARLEGSNQPLPSTLTVQTPRGTGHCHRWFLGSAPSTVAKLGPKLDTRGEGGYVLVPPSVTSQGSYSYIGDTDEIAAAPEWLGAKIRASREGKAANEAARLDDPVNISRAVIYAQTTAPAIEGQGGDTRTYEVACGIRDFGLSRETVLKCLQKHFNPRCVPSWAPEELSAKVERAFAYAQNEAGSKAAAPPQETFAHLSQPQNVSESDTMRKRFKVMNEQEMSMLPEPSWLLKQIIPAKSLVLMIGQFDSYKSFLALDISLTLASGLAGWECEAREQVPVLYAPSEGMHEIARRRKPAWKLARDIEDKDIPFYMVEDVPWLKFQDDLAGFIAGIQESKIAPKLIVIDTVASAMLGLNENDAHDVGLFIQAAKTLKSVFGCTVLAVHHLGKDASRGSRGNSALPAGFDVILEVEAHQQTMSVELTIKKMKDAERRKKPYMFQGEVLSQSLVFSPVDPAQFRAMNGKDETLGHQKVAAALRALGALSEATAVTTRVFATQLCPQADGDTHETYDRALRGFSRELNHLAKGRLEAFVIEEGRNIRWYIPAQSSDAVEEF